MDNPFSGVPGAFLDHRAEPPKVSFALVAAKLDQCPALALRQGDDAVNVLCHDLVGDSRNSPLERTAPASVGVRFEDFLDVAPGQDLRTKRPGVVVRGGVGLGSGEPVKDTAIIEVVFDKRRRHSLVANDLAARRSMD